MKEKQSSRFQMAIGFVVIALLLWLLWLGFKGAARYIQELDSDLAKAIVAAGATVLASVIALVGSKAYEARLAIKQDLRLKKTPVYEEIVKTLYRAMFANMLGEEPLTEDELKAFFAKATEHLTIWGSDSLLKSWGYWKTHAGDSDALFLFEDLLLAIRKDLGHRNSGLEKGSILRLFVTDIDEHLKKARS